MRAVGSGAVGRRLRPGEDPTHTQIWNRGLTGLALGVCLGVGGVPHQLYGGGRVRVPDFMATLKRRIHTLKCEGN